MAVRWGSVLLLWAIAVTAAAEPGSRSIRDRMKRVATPVDAARAPQAIGQHASIKRLSNGTRGGPVGTPVYSNTIDPATSFDTPGRGSSMPMTCGLPATRAATLSGTRSPRSPTSAPATASTPNCGPAIRARAGR